MGKCHSADKWMMDDEHIHYEYYSAVKKKRNVQLMDGTRNYSTEWYNSDPRTNNTYFLLVVDPSFEVLDVRVLPGVPVDSRKLKRDHGGDRGILERTVEHSWYEWGSGGDRQVYLDTLRGNGRAT